MFIKEKEKTIRVKILVSDAENNFFYLNESISSLKLNITNMKMSTIIYYLKF